MYTLPWQTLADASRLLTRPAAVLRDIRREHLRPDFVAALTVSLIVIPQAMAYALLAGLPPQSGLYAAILSCAIGALWGSSRQLQTGPTNTSSLLTLSALTLVVPALAPGSPEYLAAAGLLAFMAGVLRVALGIASLGLLVRFVSDAVIVGFTASAGILIAVNQAKNLLRLNVPSTAELADTVRVVGPKLGEAHWPSLALGLGAIAVILVLRRVNRRIPGPLVAIVLAAAAAALLDLGVKTVGPLPSGLPPYNPLPVTNLALIGQLSSSALSIAAIGLVEAISIARGMAVRTGERLNSNQEFVGQGLANIASGVFSGYPVSGSFTRSAVNLQAGAAGPLSGILTSVLLLAATLSLSSLASYIPLAALAGVLIVTAFALIDRKEMARIWRIGGADRVTLVVTLAATLLLPLHFAILAGILMSLGSYLLRTSTPKVRTVIPAGAFHHFEHRPDLSPCPQLGVTEILGDLYFGAVEHVEEQIHQNRAANPGQRFLLLRMHSVHNCDISGIHTLEAIVRNYREQGGDLFMVRVRPAVLEEMTSSGFLTTLGPDRLLEEDAAIDFLFHRILDPAICIYECPLRVFRECQNLPKPLHEDNGRGTCPALAGPVLAPAPTVEPRALWRALHEPAPPVVIDVREPREYRQGHVPGSRLIPLPALLADPGQAPRDRPVVLVCRGGRRSARAAAALRAAGHSNVASLRGGMLAWESAVLLEARSMSGSSELSPNLGLDLVRATEAAALAAGRWTGLGRLEEAERAATDAMMSVLESIAIDGTVRLAEEGRLGAGSTFATGQRLGARTGPPVDVLVDALEGRRLLAGGYPGALSAIAVAPRGAIWAPRGIRYMEKIVVNAEVAPALAPECLDAPAAWTLALVARAKGKQVRDLVVFVLDRPRHADLVAEIRAAGSHVLLRSGGDLNGALMACLRDGKVDAADGLGRGAARADGGVCGQGHRRRDAGAAHRAHARGSRRVARHESRRSAGANARRNRRRPPRLLRRDRHHRQLTAQRCALPRSPGRIQLHHPAGRNGHPPHHPDGALRERVKDLCLCRIAHRLG